MLLPLFVLFPLAIVLSVLRLTDSDYPDGIFKLFSHSSRIWNLKIILQIGPISRRSSFSNQGFDVSVRAAFEVIEQHHCYDHIGNFLKVILINNFLN